MKLTQETMTAKPDTLRQMDLSAATTDGEEQYKWLKERRKKERKAREPDEPESLSLF